MAAQVLDLAGGTVQFPAREPDFIGRVQEQHFGAADRPRGGFPQQRFQKIRRSHRVVVQEHHPLTAVLQGPAHSHIVHRRKPAVGRLGQEHRVGGQMLLQLLHRVVGGGIVQKDDLEIPVSLFFQTLQTPDGVLPAVVVGNDDPDVWHGYSLNELTASMTARTCSSVMP